MEIYFVYTLVNLAQPTSQVLTRHDEKYTKYSLYLAMFKVKTHSVAFQMHLLLLMLVSKSFSDGEARFEN